MAKRIAIVGGGIAGLTAAYLLHRDHEITLFEKSGRLGGNAYTYATRDGQYLDIAVAAFGRSGYPNFYRLLSELGVDTRLCLTSYLSLHDLDTQRGLYFAAPSRSGDRISMGLLSPALLRASAGLFAGLMKAQRLMDQGKLQGKSFGECLDAIPIFKGDTRRIVICVLCLLSSMSADEVLETPAEFFLNKLRAHNDVISPRSVFSVRCADGGTKSYVDALVSKFRERVVLNSRIRAIDRSQDTITVLMEDGEKKVFDALVLACNADQALGLLGSPTEKERAVLGAWKYKEGRVVVHRDHSSFPPRKLTQAYTFLYTERDGKFATSVNGALWHEPNAPKTSDYISSQHPNFPIREDLLEFETVLRTPMFDNSSLAAVRALPELNGTLNTYYCGSHFGFGLHEDAVTSAIAVARRLRPCHGADLPSR